MIFPFEFLIFANPVDYKIVELDPFVNFWEEAREVEGFSLEISRPIAFFTSANCLHLFATFSSNEVNYNAVCDKNYNYVLNYN